MVDADALLTAARRPLVLGAGGGGDVVGALATAEACRIYHGSRPVVGGVAWERLGIDPHAGPRAASEIEDAEELTPGLLLAGPDTRIRETGVPFAEAHMARFLGERTLLVDVLPGPTEIARGLRAAAERLAADLLIFVDVGGDVLGHGDEPGLASPLCDAVMLAAAARLADRGRPVLGGLFGPGCDGELTLAELGDRLSELAAAGGVAGARALTPPVASRLEEAVGLVPTEASAQALRCYRGERGWATIRRGERTVPLTPAGAMTVYFDVSAAARSAARLVPVVASAGSLEEANDALHGLGIDTELDFERARVDR